MKKKENRGAETGKQEEKAKAFEQEVYRKMKQHEEDNK